jgi:uncharacterized protein
VLRLRGLPHLPPITSFAELSVRTYATIGGKPGIFFLSLDAESPLAVAAARRAYRLPYFRARMAIEREGNRIAYSSERVSDDGPPARLGLRYRPKGERQPAEPGTLEYFLAERYCLYTTDERRRPYRADIHHRPWPLQPAEADIDANSMASPWRVELPGDPSTPLRPPPGRRDLAHRPRMNRACARGWFEHRLGQTLRRPSTGAAPMVSTPGPTSGSAGPR